MRDYEMLSLVQNNAAWTERRLKERIAFLEETVVAAYGMVEWWTQCADREAREAFDAEGDLDRLVRAVPDRLRRSE